MKIPASNKFALLDKFCMIVSLFSLTATLLCGILRRVGFSATPDVISVYFLPVLTAAAVGYLPNFAAISLLFRPYRPVRWLKNLQGVIPKEQPLLASRLGEEITENLLPPDDLAATLSKTVSDYLQSPELLSGIRRNAGLYIARYKRKWRGC